MTDALKTNWRELLPLGLFSATYIVLAAALALVRGSLEFVFYVAVLLPLAAVVGVVHHRVRLEHAALWGLSLWGLAHMAGGLVAVPANWPTEGDSRVLYSLWLIPGGLKYDHVVHAFGFGLTTWICWQALRAMISTGLSTGPSARLATAELGGAKEVRPTFGMLVLCVAAGLGFGALNEVVEFAATRLLPETNVGGYVNTGWDLVANLVGATIAAGLIAAGRRPRR